MEENRLTPIRTLTPSGTGTIVLDRTGIWIPKPRPGGTQSVPDLTELVLGSLIRRRQSSQASPSDVDLSDLIETSQTDEEAQRKLVSRASLIPYSAITQVVIASPTKFRRPKLCIEYFDQKAGKLASKEYRVLADDLDVARAALSSPLSDRLVTC